TNSWFSIFQGPSPELMMKHRFTPSDLSNLSAKIVETNGTCQFNITWILKADGRSHGSLWDPNITVCYTESEVEVDFTPSPFCPEYKIRFCESDECDDPTDPTDYSVLTSQGNDTRISKRIPVNGQRRKIFRELIPYFPKCRNDCRRKNCSRFGSPFLHYCCLISDSMHNCSYILFQEEARGRRGIKFCSHMEEINVFLSAD
ncbi:hypothetical protein JD844_012768, partial [Phrynosoma platyrhinos]